jgi:hypothetical protein
MFGYMSRQLALVPPDPAPARRGGRLARFAAVELGIWAAVYGTYLAVRGLTIGSPHEALAHAVEVVDVERAVGIFREASLQQHLSPLTGVLSVYYILGFAPLIGVMTVWLGLRQRGLYRRLRNALLISVSMATFAYVFFPTAPPRLAGLGIADTVGMSAHDTGSFIGIRFNPYAAVPSMHVGWSVVIAYFGFQATRRRWLRGLFAAHPLVMALAVTATGNHFFFDCVTGAAVALVTLALTNRFLNRTPRLRAIDGDGRTDAEIDDLAA